MRKVEEQTLKFNQLEIKDIKLNLKSRDDIVKILAGIQKIYINKKTRDDLFNLLRKEFAPNVNKRIGRTGMNIWNVFILGVLRVSLNIDYDRLCDLANEHKSIRAFLGHTGWDEDYVYSLQNIKDNVKFFNKELLDKINLIIVNYELKSNKMDEQKLSTRCDSFVLKTNVHYPSDTSLLWDAARRSNILSYRLSKTLHIKGFRQSHSNLRILKSKLTEIIRANKSNNIDNKKQACKQYVKLALNQVRKIKYLLSQLNADLQKKHKNQIKQIEKYLNYVTLFADQILRRIIKEESIPHDEKVFSIFLPYTEMICKGKAGVPFELGLKVNVLEDCKTNLILLADVIQKSPDNKTAIPIIKEALKHFNIGQASFDKGYYSPENQEKLSQLLTHVTLPKKGKKTKVNLAIENQTLFKKARKKHPGIESAINALQNQGLDKCKDKSLPAFYRYVGFALIARNLQIIGQAALNKKRALYNYQKKAS